MATITIIGSCAGTEPQPGRNHTSWTLSAGGRIYFFDAGECCSFTAHRMGLDLLQIHSIFISHGHHDYVAGLAGLMENIHCVAWRRSENPAAETIRIFMPDLTVWDNIYGFLKLTTGGHKVNYGITAAEPSIGQFYDDGTVKVSAFPTEHLPPQENSHPRSLCYRIEADGKVIVFSGDIRNLQELDSAIGRGCDVLLCETGHHSVKSVCDYAESKAVKKLVFVHNGREILNRKPTAQEAISHCSIPCIVSEDEMQLEV